MLKGDNVLTSIAFLNGDFIAEEKACISIKDRGFLFGEGVFTTIRVENGSSQYLEEHISRLKRQCSEMAIKFRPFSSETIDNLIKLNGAVLKVWRLKVMITSSNLVITIHPYEQSNSLPVRLTIYPEPIERPLSKMKSMAYVDRFYVKRYAEEQGYDDALVLSRDGYVLETAFSNVYWTVGENLYTPDPSLSLLWGIMIEQICRVKESEGYNIQKVRVSPSDIVKEAKFFVCNSLCVSQAASFCHIPYD